MTFAGDTAYVVAGARLYEVQRTASGDLSSLPRHEGGANLNTAFAVPQPNPNTILLSNGARLLNVSLDLNVTDDGTANNRYRRNWLPLANAHDADAAADVWAVHGKSLILETFRSNDRAYAEFETRLSSPPTAVVVGSNGDVYILEAGKGGRSSNLEALSSPTTPGLSTWQPAAKLPFSGVITAIAADPSGGIVFQDSQGRLHHWTDKPAYEVGP
jgi:hypothetical protein